VVDEEDMFGSCRTRAPATLEEVTAELLRELDSKAARGLWREKRAQDRRKFRSHCRVYHIAPDGERVHSSTGKTRDLSLGGVGFVSGTHFQRHAPLLVSVTSHEGGVRHFSGTVAYCRFVRKNWYLTGVKMTQLPTLDPPPGGTLTEVKEAAATDAPPTDAPGRNPALLFLAAVADALPPSEDDFARIVALSKWLDPAIRRATVPVFQGTGGECGVASLMELLDDAKPEVRGAAADALGQLRATQAIERLRALLEDPSVGVTLCAAQALVGMGDKSGYDAAARCVRGDAVFNRQAACVLGMMAAHVLGMIVGRSFPATSEGVVSARQYLQANPRKP
jgi:hypothetical protein